MKTTKWLIGGGIVVALGAVAFFTRKYWLPKSKSSESESSKKIKKVPTVTTETEPVKSPAVEKVEKAYIMYRAAQPIGVRIKPPTDIIAWAKERGYIITESELLEYNNYKKQFESIGKPSSPKSDMNK